jgi:DNA-binding CsgD family transcriptional regulator
VKPLPDRDLRRALDFLRECYAFRDVDGFLAHLIAAIPSLVPSDFTSYTAFTPRKLVTRVSRPSEPVSLETDRLFEQTMHQNPVVAYHRRTSNGQAVKITDFITQRQFRRTAHYSVRSPARRPRASDGLHVGGPGRYLLLMREHGTALPPRALEAAGLSRREAEVLSHVAQGLTNEAVGSLLGISQRTVQKHLERIFDKLGVETRTAAVARALGLAGHPSPGGHA